MSEHESKYASKCKGGTNSLGPSERAENHPPLLDPLRLALTQCGCARPNQKGIIMGPVCETCTRILRLIKQEFKGYGRIDVRF
jgi:hypothetical protein